MLIVGNLFSLIVA